MYELAIYGGTFAPVHNGHVHAAKCFFEAIKPDKLLIIPTLIPPHKQLDFKDNPCDRLKMLKLAFKDEECFDNKLEISDYELTAPPPSYTVNTLRHFTAPDTHITFLVGTDMFLTLDAWKNPEEIFRLCTIALIKRELGKEYNAQIDEKLVIYRTKYNADIKVLNFTPIELSSTDVRKMKNDERQKYLPRAVFDYIEVNRLYEANN